MNDAAFVAPTGAQAESSETSDRPLTGLTTIEARARRAACGPNIAVPEVSTHLVRKVLRKFVEPLVAILLAAAFVSALARDWASASVIIAVVVLSAALEIFQEHRAERAAEALKRSVATQSTVLRDGVPVRLPVEDVVPGDVVLLRAGDLIPADGVVAKSRDALANEAILTGEPYPVAKRPASAHTDDPAASALFAGTSLVGGEATLLVAETGPRTRFGAIADALQSRLPPTAFELGLRRLGRLILQLTLFLVLFVLLTQFAFHRPPFEALLFAVALAVGLTPELLPMITTVTLSRGAIRMARKHVIVKRLSAIHDFGAMDVLCTDKTGTLTEARVELAESIDAAGKVSERVRLLAAVNSRFASGTRTVLDDAILGATAESAFGGWSKIDDAPFDFERRRLSVLTSHGEDRLLIVKGAPEAVLSQCVALELESGATVQLDDKTRIGLRELEREKAAQGFRLLGVAVKASGLPSSTITPADETALVFVGFCVFLDPPKSSATAAVSRLRAAGITVKVISGDAPAVVEHLIRMLDMPATGTMTGAEIDQLSDAQLALRIKQADMFARTSPDQKQRIVHALRKQGCVVGFLGDGINDAPAIRAANVGLSVEGASDVAREAADMILLDQDLGVVADGVEEGRRTFANVMKYIRMGASSNFGNVLSMAAASILLPFLPLLPIQVLVNNFIYDLSETGIPFDNVEGEEIAKPQSWDLRAVLRFTLVMGPLSSAFDLATFGMLRLYFQADAESFRTAWFLESLMTQILVIFIIRTTRPVLFSRPHPILTATSLATLTLAIVLVLSPAGALLGFVALPPAIWIAVAALSFAYLLAAECLKRAAIRITR